MPSERQLLFALLRFGAADPEEKSHVLDDYLEECKGPLGQAHVASAEIEIIESLYKGPHRFAVSRKEEEICGEIENLAERLLEENFTTFQDRSVYSSKAGLELQARCKQALEILGVEEETTISFFVLMCHTTD